MLLQFSVSNFRSFRKLQTLDLAASSADKLLPENCIIQELPGISSRQWLRGAAIYGANASGKTSVLDALQALVGLVTESAKMTDPKDSIPQIEPFALRAGEEKTPTAFEVVLLIEGMRYAYRVAATRERIWHESVRVYPTAKAQLWFSRDWDPETEIYRWTPERPTDFSRDSRLEGDTLRNMLFLSKHIASNRTELNPLFRWFKERLQFLHLATSSGIHEGFTLRQLHEKTSLRDPIIKLLRHADLGVVNARSEELQTPRELLDAVSRFPAEIQERMQKQRFFDMELIHRGAKGAEIPLPWDTESAGTRRFFELAGPWLDILANGYVVCIDELDTSMHPLMVMEMLRLLFSDKGNAKRAQIIFTTHNPLLLDNSLLRRDQVWFTDKDAEGEGHLYPLTQYAPRQGESLIRGYISGRYGAVPFLPKGLLGQLPGYEVVHGRRTPRTRKKAAKGNE